MTTYRGLRLLLALPVLLGPVERATGAPADGSQRCVAQVAEGTLAGSRSDEVCRYRAVPYAAPPVGALRFRAPQPVEPWHGARDAASPADIVCPRAAANVTESYAGPAPAAIREDCLYLNVTHPAEPAITPRPVIVFFHGGAFRSGSGFQADFEARKLALATGAVVITANSRLGILGYAELGHLDPSFAGSGNNGLRDQIAVLRWARRNAGAFGGDAANVTAVGQSAGAISLSAMLAGSPQPLMDRAVLLSGNGYLVRTAAQARATTAALQQLGAGTPNALAAMPIEQLVRLQRRLEMTRPVSGSFLFGPHVDGELVPGSVNDRLAAGSARGIDVWLNTNANEATFFAIGRPALTLVPAVANPYFPPTHARRLPAIVSAYTRLPTALAGPLAPLRERPLMRMLTDQLFRVPATRMAEAHGHHGHAYLSRFDWRARDPRNPAEAVGSTHVLDLAFWFGGLRTSWLPGARPMADGRAAQAAVSDQLMQALRAFVHGGVPSAGAADWPAYVPQTRATMLFGGAAPRVALRPDERQRAVWRDVAFDHLTYNLPIG